MSQKIIIPFKFIVSEYDEVSFIIPGKPEGKGRPRFVRRGNFVQTYTPPETKAYENKVRTCYRAQVGDKKLTGAIETEITGYFPIPSGTSNTKKEELSSEDVPYLSKCDADNLGKIICDALNTITYNDDSQIYKMTVKKYYSNNPRVEVKFKAIKETRNTS